MASYDGVTNNDSNTMTDSGTAAQYYTSYAQFTNGDGVATVTYTMRGILNGTFVYWDTTLINSDGSTYPLDGTPTSVVCIEVT